MGSITLSMTPERKSNRFCKEKYFRLKQSSIDLMEISERVTPKQNGAPIYINQLSEKMNQFKYLPLELFEDTTFNRISNEELFLKIEHDGPIQAQILTENNHQYQFVLGEIIDYNFVKETFRYTQHGVTGTCGRIYFICHFEDPIKYTSKLLKAFEEREMLDSQLRYNFYIDNMSTKDVTSMSNWQETKIKLLIQQKVSLKEVRMLYKRVQNKLQFDYYLENQKDKITNLKLENISSKILSRQGQMKQSIKCNLDQIQVIERGESYFYLFNFKAIRQQLSDLTIFNQKDIIKAMQAIVTINEEMLNLELFYYQEQPYLVDTLKQKQESLLGATIKSFKEWSPRICNILKTLQIPQIKKLIYIIRMKQQEMLTNILSRSVLKFKQYMQERVPLQIRILNASQVQNSKKPIFFVSIIYNMGFKYTYSIKDLETDLGNQIKILFQESSYIRDPESILTDSKDIPRFLKCPELNENEYDEIISLLRLVQQQMLEYLRQYTSFKHIFEMELEQFVKQCKMDDLDEIKFKNLIYEVIQTQNHIRFQIPQTITVSIFIVENHVLLHQINSRLDNLIKEMIAYLVSYANILLKQVIKEFEELQLKIQVFPKDIEELEEQKLFLNEQIIPILEEKYKSIERITGIYEILDEFNCIIKSEDLKLRWNVLSYPHLIQTLIEKQSQFLVQRKIELKQQFVADLLHFRNHIEHLDKVVAQFSMKQQDNCIQLQQEALRLKNELNEAKEGGKLMNQRELLFELPISNFNKIEHILLQFEPLEKLWSIVSYWKCNNQNWINDSIDNLNPVEINAFVLNSINQLENVNKFALNNKLQNILQIGQRILSEIREFKLQLPLLQSLTEPGMKQRHWELLLKDGQNIQNKSFLEMKEIVKDHRLCIKIGLQAKEELQIETELNQIYKEYQQLLIKKDENSFINLDQLLNNLDDQLFNIGIMQQNKNNVPFQEQLNSLEQQLLQSLEYVEQLLVFQTNYQELFPIFQQSDLLKQLPMEVNKFRFLEKFQIKLIQFKECRLFKSHNNQLNEQNQKLIQLQKSLANYLDKKRDIFHRLYFISNQMLLQLNSQQNPKNYIPHIFHFQIILNGDYIIEIYTSQTQLSITPVNYKSTQPEDYLPQLLEQMQRSLQKYQSAQMEEIQDLVEFTHLMDQAFPTKPNTHLSLYQYLQQYPQDSFEWQRQFKYYINQNNLIEIKILQHVFHYDYEFQEFKPLNELITQNDRYFVHFAFAFANQFGCAVYGNSSKTEIIHQFSSLLGKYHITLSTMNYQLLPQIIKGVSGSGSYCILRNIDLLDKEIISIMVAQLSFLYQAKSHNQDFFDFDGQIIKLVPTFQFFVTQKHSPFDNTPIRKIFRIISITSTIDYTKIQNDLFRRFLNISDISLNARQIQNVLKEIQLFGVNIAIKNLNQPEEIMDYLGIGGVKVTIQQILQSRKTMILMGEIGKTELLKQMYPKSSHFYLDALPSPYYFGTFENEGVLQRILQKTQSNTIILETKDIEPFVDIEQINFPNGFKFPLQDHKIIFEMTSLQHISPSTILRVGLYNHQIELDVPSEGQPFIHLVDHFPSPITKKHQILTFLKLLSLKIAPTAQCAVWAFASHLSTDTKLLMQRQINELNSFKDANLDLELQPVVLQKINILYLGSSASGKTYKLNQSRDVFRAHLNVQSPELLAYCSAKLIKKRKGIYTIGMIQIDDIHLIQQPDFLRQLLDRQGWEDVQLLDFHMIATSQISLPQRIARHFLHYFCEQAQLQSIFNPIQTSLFDQMKQFFVPTPKKPHYRISIHDVMKQNANSLHFYHRIDDEQDRLLFQQKYQIQFKENTDYADIFKKNQLIYFDELGQIMDYLLQILRQTNFKIIMYGPCGYGKKTILNLALKMAQTTTKIHEDPSLELLSELVIKDQVICVYDQDGIKNIASKSTFLSKFSIIYVPKWPLEAYQQIETYNFDVAYNLYCYLQQLSKNITPSKYVQFTRQLSQFIVQRNAQLAKDITKLQSGLTLLYSAQLAVNQINISLNEMKPKLEISAVETQQLLEQLQQERIIADQKREQILADESVAEKEQQIASQLSKESQAKVEKVKGDLEITLLEVQKLRKEHLVEIKSLGSPPKAVRVILGGVVILFSESIKMDMKNEDYLELAKKHLLNDTKELLDLLQNYNRDCISPQVITRLETKILCDSDFTLERARQCSHAVKFLYSWVKGMYDYNKVYVETQPVRDALKERQQILNELNSLLNQKKQELVEIEMKLKECEERLENHRNRREQLENQIEECSLMSKRSTKLIEGFKEEQKRWSHDIYLRKGYETRNVGDAIICCSILCFGGELDSNQREELYKYMWNYLQSVDLKYSEKCTLSTYLNLSEDTFQKENQKIIEYKLQQQLCILIDPQLQGIKLLDLKVIRSNQGKLIQQYIKQRQLICVDISDQYPEDWDNRVYYVTLFGVSNIPNKVAVHSCLVNFTISQKELEERILKTLIDIESPSLELKRLHNLQILEQDQLTLIKVEQSILNLLANQGNVEILLKDEVLVRELQNSKHIYQETNNKIEITKQLNNEIFVYREQYRQLSEYLAIIYKLIYQFSKKNRYYQYSLDHYLKLLQQLNINGSNQIALNIQSIKQSFTTLILSKQLQYLYTKTDYLLFCFTLSIELLIKKKIINPEEFKVFITTNNSPTIINPTIYISDYMWNQIVRTIQSIQRLPIFNNILIELTETPNKFKQFYLNEIFPIQYQQLTSFQQILLINAFRPDLTKKYIIKLIENTLQIQWEFSKYLLNLNLNADDKLPILIIDNQEPLFQNAISLGIGQNHKAEKIIQEASQAVISNPIELLNCQFGEQFINSIDINTLNYKLILHVDNSNTFPNNWIVGSQKIRIHEPDTIVQNLRNTINQVVNPNIFFSLNLFHAICQLRFKFNLQSYRFSSQDLELALKLETPFLRELIYQSQISTKLTQMFFKTVNSSSIKEGYIYTGGELKMIKCPNKEGYFRYLEDLGQINDYLSCGISFNQWIIIQNQENKEFLKQLSSNEISNPIEQIIERIERYLPLPLKDCCQNISYKVEMRKFNILINQISLDLGKLKLYLQGECVFDSIVEELIIGQIPKQWREYSFLIKKDESLGGWIFELFERVQFFHKFENAKCYNISAFYQPKLFLKLIQGDYLQFNYSNQHFLEIEEKPQDGVYLYGIKLVGAKYVEMSKKFKLLPNFEFESDLPLLHIEDGAQQQYDYECNLFQGEQIIFTLKLNGNNLEEVHAYL